MKKRKKQDFFVITFYLTLTTIIVLLFKPNHIIGTFLYFFFPSLYLTVRHWNIYKHVMIFSWVFGIMWGFVMEVISSTNSLWTYKPLLPFLSFQGKPMEAIFWYVMYTWLVVAIFKIFFEKHRHSNNKEIVKHHLIFFSTLFLLFAVFFIIYVLNPAMFVMQFAYMKFGFFMVIIPVLYVLIKHKNLIPGILKVCVTLFILSLVYEIVGLHMGWWSYGTQSLKMIQFGTIIFPIEELILWVILGSVCVIAWYEEFERNLS